MESPGWLKDNCQYNPDTSAVALWRVDLSNPGLDAFQACLSDDEVQRADKFVLDPVRNTFVRTRCALRIVLARCLSQQANNSEKILAGALHFQYGEQGKPELISPTTGNLQFNLSHSENIALIAVTRGPRIGVDVSGLGRKTDWKPIAKRSFSTSELNQLLALPELDQEKTFHRIWTQIEAYTKALGDGYSYGFQKFSVVVDVGGHAGLLCDENDLQSLGAWNILSIDSGSASVSALAYEGASLTRIRQWEFNLNQDWS